MRELVIIETAKEPDLERLRSDACDLLFEAQQQGFESVIILGFRDGGFCIRSSEMIDRLKLLGALERAKHHILSMDCDMVVHDER